MPEPILRERRIITIPCFPPIPCRQFDWCAYVDGEEERRRHGFGRSEQEAINDLVVNHIREE